MTNMQTYKEFISNSKINEAAPGKIGHWSPNGKTKDRLLNRLKKKVKKFTNFKDAGDKINEITKMTHSNGKFTFSSDKNEPGKGQFSHLPTRVERKRDWKKTGKKIKNKIIKKFTDFNGIR